jgi:hypothetical protein
LVRVQELLARPGKLGAFKLAPDSHESVVTWASNAAKLARLLET